VSPGDLEGLRKSQGKKSIQGKRGGKRRGLISSKRRRRIKPRRVLIRLGGDGDLISTALHGKKVKTMLE